MPETPHNLEELNRVSGSDNESAVPARTERKTFHWTAEGKTRAAEITSQVNDLRSQLATAEQRGDMQHATEILDQIEKASTTIQDITQTEQDLSEQRYQEHLKNPGFINDKTKRGWILQEDTFPLEIAPEDLDIPHDLIPTEFLKEGEEAIPGDEMLKRSKEMEGTLAGQAYAEYLLSHQDQISQELRGEYLIFPGTTWRDSDDGLCVPCLGWGGDKWDLDFLWLGHDSWHDNDRVVRLRK